MTRVDASRVNFAIDERTIESTLAYPCSFKCSIIVDCATKTKSSKQHNWVVGVISYTFLSTR